MWASQRVERAGAAHKSLERAAGAKVALQAAQRQRRLPRRVLWNARRRRRLRRVLRRLRLQLLPVLLQLLLLLMMMEQLRLLLLMEQLRVLLLVRPRGRIRRHGHGHARRVQRRPLRRATQGVWPPCGLQVHLGRAHVTTGGIIHYGRGLQ